MGYWQLFFLALIGGLVSLLGGVLLLSNRGVAKKVALYSAPFAAGALIAAAFYDLLPEALEETENHTSVLLMVAIGILLFFLLERRLRWFHHHHEHDGEGKSRQVPSMIVIGDTLHNAIDGVAIALAFLVDPYTGVITTLAVSIHELPQEIGDFGLLLSHGWSRRKTLIANALSAMATVIAASVVYFFGSALEGSLSLLLGLTAGALVYIACSDIVPEVHEQHFSKWWKDKASLLFIFGMFIVVLATYTFHQLIKH